MTTGQAPARPGWRAALGPVVVTVVTAAVVLGPALRPGVVLSYDLVWSPDARLTPFATGVDTPAPRAVPSDAAAWLLGLLVTPGVAQKLVLGGVLVLAGLGASGLVRVLRPTAGRLAACTAAVAAVWNPFVAERLVIGQWTVLLGYAVLPWAVRAALRVRAGHGTVTALCGWAVLASVGGANSLVLVGPPVLVLLLLPQPVWRAVLAWLAVVAGGAGAWAVPALWGGLVSDPAGFTVFAARSDGPMGLVVSLAGGGGFWNPASYPAERRVAALAVAAAMLTTAGVVAVARQARRARDRERPGPADDAGRCVGTGVPVLVVVALLGLLLAVASGTPWSADAWSRLAEVPGGALLRDSQKVVALWVVLGAAGVGLLVDGLVRHRAAALVPAIGLAVVAPLVLPTLAWGERNRVEAVTVPADLRDVAAELSSAPAGDVGLLPWRQYRRYGWNDARVSLSLVPRMVDQRVLYDDSLPLSSGRIAGESPRSAAVTAAVDGGADAWDALVAQGVRYVVVEKDTGLPTPDLPAGAGRVLADTAHLQVVEVAGSSGATTGATTGAAGQGGRASSATGWGVTLATLAAWLVLATRRVLRRNG